MRIKEEVFQQMDSFQQMVSSVAIALKPLGFRKKKDHFIRINNSDGNVGFVSFIKERNPDPVLKVNGITSFTVEAAAASKRLLDFFRKHLYYSPADKPSPADRHFSTRLGYELGYGQDHWWRVDPSNCEAITSEIIDAICAKLVPAIEAGISDQSLRQRMLKTFDEGHRSNPAYLLQTAYLLKEAGDISNLSRVANHIREHFSDRMFENTRSLPDFLDELERV